MPFAPQSWQMYQAIQKRINDEVLVGTPAASPFNAFSAADATKYGTTPFGSVTQAIYIGIPKELSIVYPRQCHILPAIDEEVARRALGGKIWDWQFVYVRLVFLNNDWWQAMQDIVAARDVMHVVMSRHAELPNAPIVQAVHELAAKQGLPTGFHYDDLTARDWACWGFIWAHKQEWTAQGGIVP